MARYMTEIIAARTIRDFASGEASLCDKNHVLNKVHNAVNELWAVIKDMPYMVSREDYNEENCRTYAELRGRMNWWMGIENHIVNDEMNAALASLRVIGMV